MNTIECEEHGLSPYCLLCTHLQEQDGLGYFAIPAEPTEPAQAWCEACDHVLEAEQGWSDLADAQAGWKLYCTACYERRLDAHTLLSWVEGISPEDDDET